MNHWLKIVSIVELEPQAMLTIRLPIFSKNIIHYDVRWASRPVGLLFVFCFLFFLFFAMKSCTDPLKCNISQCKPTLSQLKIHILFPKNV